VEQRRFTLRHLRDLGFGKKSLEGIILEEAEVLIKKLQYNEIQVKTTFNLKQTNKQNKLLGFSPQANYTDRVTAAFRRS
jgi:hypothetical protein